MTFGMYNVDYEQRIYNPERMRKYRLDRAHKMLKKHGLGAVAVYDYDTFRYLGFFSRHNYARRRPGSYVLLIRDAGFPYAQNDPTGTSEAELNPWMKDRFVLKYQTRIQSGCSLNENYNMGLWTKQAEEIKGILKQHHVADLPMGVDFPGFHLINECEKAGIKVVDGNPAIAEARMVKNEDEIECLRTAGAIVESAHWAVCKALRPGVTEWQMAGVAAKACFDLGAEEMEGPSFVVCSGYRSGHNVPAMPTDRIVRPGEMFVIDINGISFQGYRTCFYRTYCVGDKPTEKQKDIYASCYTVQRAMETSLGPGQTNYQYTKKAWGKAKGELPSPEWPKPGRYHQAGNHQLGLDSGDPGPGAGIGPNVFDAPEFKLEPGMVFAAEVGTFDWDGKKWGYD
ncbi:MAG: M24 family metallopeptidase, partial [Candidatus Bathyarchaeota archaeon]